MVNPTDFTEHRPWELPKGSWVMAQRWEKLLFAHWSFPPEQIEPLIPKGLTLETYDGKAWIGVVPFLMNNVHPRGLFNVPWLSKFLELNVRTYVVADNKPGVFFFSLDAANSVGVFLGRNWFRLPYFNANMSLGIDGDNVRYHSTRSHRKAHSGIFEATYKPVSEVFHAERGTRDHFLTERYCLYAIDRHNQLYRAEVHHPQWPLQHATADININTVAPIDIPDESPILHYADGLDVVVWALRKI